MTISEDNGNVVYSYSHNDGNKLKLLFLIEVHAHSKIVKVI
jgi:hypothetical protein